MGTRCIFNLSYERKKQEKIEKLLNHVIIESSTSEVELSAVVNLCYLSARNKYRVEREDKAGKGFVDFIFYPDRKSADCIILELKVDSTLEEAIDQIKNKKYAF